jgi:hypothetical protein
VGDEYLFFKIHLWGLMPPYLLFTMPASASKNLRVLLESVLADATTDSPPGRPRGGLYYLFLLITGNLPRRASKNLMVLLTSHSYGIR